MFTCFVLWRRSHLDRLHAGKVEKNICFLEVIAVQPGLFLTICTEGNLDHVRLQRCFLKRNLEDHRSKSTTLLVLLSYKCRCNGFWVLGLIGAQFFVLDSTRKTRRDFFRKTEIIRSMLVVWTNNGKVCSGWTRSLFLQTYWLVHLS